MAEDDRSDPDAAKEAGALMLAHPALAKRPVIDDRETVRIGPRQVRVARGVPRIGRSPQYRPFSLRFRAMPSHRPVHVGEPDSRYTGLSREALRESMYGIPSMWRCLTPAD